MNDVATLRCDNPFPFQLKHLSLSGCHLTYYDFCILMNCVGDSLESLDLLQVSLMDSQCSTNVSKLLAELCRLSNLRSLKVDRTWAEFQQDAKNFSCPRLQLLTLLNVKFEDLFSPELRKFTSSLACFSVTLDGKDYKISDLDELLRKFHIFAATKWPTMKFGYKNSRIPGRKPIQPKYDAKTELSFVLGWPRIEPEDTVADFKDRLKEVFAFESLKVYIPARTHKANLGSPLGSPAMSPVGSSEDEEIFVTAFDSMKEISAAS
ncbi:hypothetical protein FO519_008135 [Halicephalobus sp. NKZ332]|nr:hypothetical protein FO519_008135 [Halicephalobus sp. NKZ332]